MTNKVIATSPIGQAPQALTYVPNAVSDGNGMQGLQPVGIAGKATRLTLAPIKASQHPEQVLTSVSLFDQGLTQVLQAAVTGLQPRQSYVLALAHQPNGEGELEPLATFVTNPASSAIVNAVGPIRQVVRDNDKAARRYLVIRQGDATKSGPVVQVQSP